jgi:heat shock protein HslJ
MTRRRSDGLWRRVARAAACTVVLAAASGIQAGAQAKFPFDREFLLDVNPMRGSKRVPILEFAANGRVSVDLWCKSGTARAEIAGSAITLTLDALNAASCPPERASADEEMIAALSQVTGWRLDGSALVLTGGRNLRFRRATN